MARPRARRGEGSKLRDDILDAAEQLLVDAGSMDAVSMRGIAEQVGCTPPAIYLHFDDKEELFFHVCARRFTEFAAALTGAGQDATDPADELRRMGRAYVRYGLERPEHYQVLFGDKVLTAVDDVPVDDLPGMDAFEALVDVIRRGVVDGAFRQVDPLTAAMAVWGAVHGLVEVLLMSPSGFEMPDVDVLVEQALDLQLCGLVPR